MAQKVVLLTTNTGSYTIPSDFGSLISVEAIGAGGDGVNAFGGGGGGAYAKTTTINGIVAGGTAYYSRGSRVTASGVITGDSWFSYGIGNTRPTTATQGVLAKGGQISTTTTVGAGGSASECIGNVKYSGGSGGATSNSGAGTGKGGGGGAAGPGGIGGNGGGGAGGSAALASSGGGGGGASLTLAGYDGNAGTAGLRGGRGGHGGIGSGGGTGGLTANASSGTAGTGGGGGGAGAGGTAGDYNGGDGATGNYWTQTSDSSTAGSGGGGGGSTRAGTPGNGGVYGGGGASAGTSGDGGSAGQGANGIIVFTYETAPKKTVFFTTTGSSTYTIPSDFGSLAAVEAIGGGAGGRGGGGGVAAGGGGAYAKSTSVSLNPGQTCYVSVGAGGVAGAGNQNGADSWFNAVSNAAPTLASQGVLAKAGTQDGNDTVQPGGAAGSCVGDVVYSGGSGARGATTNEARNRGGGGGAAGPFGAGGDGANGYDTTAVNAGGGGGGGAGTADGAGVAGTTGWLTGGGIGGGGGIKLIGYTSNSNGSSANIALTVPSGTADGDLMVMYVKSSSNSNAPSTPSGWTLGVRSDAAAIGLYYRTASSEPASYTVTTAGTSVANSGHIVTYRGAAIDVIGTVSSSANPIVSASITTTLPNTVLLNFIASGATGVTYTTPSGYTAMAGLNDVAVSTAVFYKSTLSDAGATGTLSVTASDTGRGTLVALKPTSTTSGSGATSTWSAAAGTAGTGAGGGGAFGTTNNIGGAGASGSYWMQSSNSATAGSGGGGGGATSANAALGGAGGLYGGGGGEGSGAGGASAGGQGIVVFSYYVNTNLPSSGTNVYGRQDTGFKVFDGLSQTTQDLGQRYVSKDYLLDVYPNIASATGTRTAPGLWAWGGSAASGSLGNGTTTAVSSPVQLGNLTTWKYVNGDGRQSTTASSVSYAIKTDGTLWAWGDNGNFALGNGTGSGAASDVSSPVQVGTLTNWKQVSYRAAINNSGALYTWGTASVGALGNGTTTGNLSTPVQVGTLTNWKQISSSISGAVDTHMLAVKSDGTLWAWGSNTSGQLGLLDIANRSSPVQIGSLTNWKQVSAGSSATSYAIKIDGTLWAWGSGTSGGLGDGTTVSKSSPIQVGSLTNWKSVAGNDGNLAFAVKTDGTLWAWGVGTSGELGDGTTVSKSSPIQVGSLTNWKLVYSLKSGVSAIKTDGTLWMWGSSTWIADGSTVSKSSPVQVGGLTSWKQVSGGLAIQDGYI